MLRTVTTGTDPTWSSTAAIFDTGGETSVPVTEKINATAYQSDTLISKEDYKVATIVIECGILPTVGLLGMSANIINMVVFSRHGLRDKMNLCLFALSLVDFLFVAVLFLPFFHCAAVLFPDSFAVQILKWKTHKFTLNFWYGFWYSSGVITALIATERCICVVWPLKSATIFTTKRMAGLIFGIIVVLNLLCSLYAFKKMVRIDIDAAGKARMVMDDTEVYKNNELVFLVIRDGILSGISFSTFCVISFVTVVTVRKLKTAMDWRQKTSSNVMDKRQMTLVKILITVSCVYIACNAPKLSLAAARFLVDEFTTVGRYRNLFYMTHRIGYVLLMVNSSVNVFIYYRQSSRFRKELQSCVCCLRNPTGEKTKT